MGRYKLAVLLLISISAVAQNSTNTPSRPRRFTEFTVATLPAASTTTGQTFIVTDAASSGSCSSGGGSFRTWCRSNGSSYDAVGDGGSGGSGASTGDSFITVSHDADLTAERILAGTANHITVTDGGANNSVTLDVGSQVVLNNQANTYTGGGLQDLGSDSLRTTGREGIGGAELSTNRLALYADHNTERVFRITDTNAGPYDTWELDNGYNINSNGLGWYNVTNAEIPFWINHSNSILMGMGTRDGIGDIGLVTQNRPNNVYAKAKVETKLLADPSTAGYKGSLSAAMVGDGRILYDAACSSSSSPTNATSSTGAFTAADVGKVFAIAHGGTGGKLLSTTVSSVTNSTTIVMATSCVTTTSADWAVVGTDNSAAMKAQTDAMHDLTPSGLDPGGGLLKVGAGVYVIKTTWTPKSSQGWITIQGTGPSSTLFVFVPVCTCSTANNNDRPFSVDFTSISTRRQIANAIAKGATTFTLSSAGDGSDLVAGEWLIIAEYDTLAGGGEPIAIDWVQVVSVVTTTVTVKHPFRTAFSVGRTYSNAAPLGGLGFVRATNDVFQNVAFKDFGIVQPDSGTAMPSIAIGYSIGSTVDNVWVDNPNGQNFYCYRGKDVTFTRNRSSSSKISNEVAACVDVMMDNNVFGGFGSAVSNYQVASSSAFTVDDGTAFFSFTNNKLPESADIAIQSTRGVHDGIIKDNQVGWVRNGGTGQGQAVVCQGCLNLTIEGNTFAGGDGTNTGVSLANTTTLNVQINSSGNIVGVNKFGTFTNVYGTMLAADSYFTLIGTEYQIVPQPGTSGAVKLYDSGGTNARTDDTTGTITSHTVHHPLAAPTVASYEQTDTCGSATCTEKWQPASTVLFVTADFTTANNTNLQLITGLSYTMPANLALKAQFDCDIVYHQNTATAALNWGVQDVTVSPTNIFATGFTQTAATTWAEQQLLTLASTTATAIGGTFTPSVITTDWHARVRLMVEQPSNASTSAVQVMVKTATGADAVVIRRGSNCSVNFQ
jgi:hypothetical protein